MRARGYYVDEVILYFVGSNKRSFSFIINICFGNGWTQYNIIIIIVVVVVVVVQNITAEVVRGEM